MTENRNIESHWGGGLTCGLVALVLAIAFVLPNWASAAHDHSQWNQLLQSHVELIADGNASQVDYGGFQQNEAALNAYLESLAAVGKTQFEAWPEQDQLAFLINAYNAATVSLILTKYPDLDSIKDIGSLFRSPWKRKFVDLFGEQWTLDDIEHGMIRGWGRYDEPRIHFAVNCAAIGCPALSNEAYEGALLEQQLDAGVKAFLADRTRNYYANNRLWLSNIFKWYAEDFEKGWQGINSVQQFVSQYSAALELDEDMEQVLSNKDLSIRHLRYDWGLNSVMRD